MKNILTIWENDPIDKPSDESAVFIAQHYSDYEIKILAALQERGKEDIFDSLEKSEIIFIDSHLLDMGQVKNLIRLIAHDIHTAKNGAVDGFKIEKFIFLSSSPLHDLTEIWRECSDIEDCVGEKALAKILKNCECHFYGFHGEHYEMGCRWWNGRSHLQLTINGEDAELFKENQ